MSFTSETTKEELENFKLSQLSSSQLPLVTRNYQFTNKDITIREILEMYTSNTGTAYKQGLVHLNDDGSVKAIAKPAGEPLSHNDLNDSTLDELQRQARLQRCEKNEKAYETMLNRMFELLTQ